jgi:hypothetical protein
MLLRELFDKDINEVSMSPGSLNKFLNSPAAQGIRAGFEFEAAMPVNMAGGSSEQDYNQDIPVYDDDEVIDFFSGGTNPISRRERGELRKKILDQYEAYKEKLVLKKFKEKGDKEIAELAKDQGFSEREIQDMLDEKDENTDYLDFKNNVISDIEYDVEQDVDWRDFWNYKNINTMMDVATKYNLDWPYYAEEKSEDEAVREIADELESVVNARIDSSEKYGGVSRTSMHRSSRWILERDNSIEVPDGSYLGLELITPSPPPLATETLKYIDRVFSWAREYGCETNDTTGFHISMSLPNATAENIDWIKLILFLGDEHVLQRFNRLGNTYAQSSFKLLDTHLSRPNVDIGKALDAIRAGLINIATTEIGKPTHTKYVSVNMKPTYVEFRSAGGDYLNNQEEIKNTFLRYVRAIAIAGDPNAERQEYLKKLYKFLKPDIGDNKASEIIRVFAMYNAGMLDLHQMKNRLKRKKAEKENLPPEKQQ